MTDSSIALLSALGSWAAALATMGAAVVALRAMKSWKEQEKTKAYQSYLMSLEAFRSELQILPSKFSRECDNSRDSSDDYRDEAKRAFALCRIAWVGYMIHSASDVQIQAWKKLSNITDSYLTYGTRKTEITEPLRNALSLELQHETWLERFDRTLNSHDKA